MSEIEWLYPNAEDCKQLAAVDLLLDTGTELSFWQRWLEEYQSWQSCIAPSDQEHDQYIFRRRKDNHNWIAEKYESGHELTYLETVHYYILNGKSMTGLESYFAESDEWRVSDERHHPVPILEYRLAKKKPMVMVNGHKVPKWETEPLNDGDTYFLVDLPSDIGYARIKWVDSVSNQAHLENGTVFKNEADIQQFVEAMRDIEEVE